MVGDEHPHAPLAQGADQVLEVGHGQGIHPGEGFIEEQIAGPLNSHGQGPGHFAAASLAAGELEAKAMQEGPQLEFLHQLLQTQAALALAHTALLQGQAEVVAHAQLAEHTGFLGEVTDAEPGPLGHGQGLNLQAIEQHRTRIGAQQAGDQVEGGGFAGAIGSQ